MARRKESRSVGHVSPSVDQMQESPSIWFRQVLPTDSGKWKLFSDAVKQTGIKRYKISVKPEDEALSPQQIKHQLKKLHQTSGN
jgi:hypothetical protein